MKPWVPGIVPDWAAPANVRAFITTREGGVSRAPFDGFNLGTHVGDDPAAVAENRGRLRLGLPSEPVWLDQVHGVAVADAARATSGETADAAVARSPGLVCAVLTADCLPVLLCEEDGKVVAVAHAGWRGLAAGVLEATVAAMDTAGGNLLAYLGPAIGPACFEVGNDVREAFLAWDERAAPAFAPGGDGKWLANLYALARQRLEALGVTRISGGGWCTYTDAQRFYSFRREGCTGRMATLIWRER